MKMGTIASPWRYDAVAEPTLQSVIVRWPAISHYASAAIPRSRQAVRFAPVTVLPIHPRSDETGQKLPSTTAPAKC